MDKKYTTIILDSSGSMSSIREEALQVLNDQIETINKAVDDDTEARVSCVTFSTEPNEPIVWLEDPSKLDVFDESDYVPGGLTALYDAVGSTVRKLLYEARDAEHLIIIISDGMENNSKEFADKDVAKLVSEAEDLGWTFEYHGANHDLASVTKHIGIKNTKQFHSTKSGTRAMSSNISSSTSDYYSK